MAKGAQALKETVLRACVDNLYKVLDFVEKELDLRNCNAKVKAKILVAVEEIFVNIAQYAYEGGGGEVTVKVSFDADSNVVSIVFIDSGVQYDPIAREDPDINLSADERPIGGLGIYITKKFFDELIYDYKCGKNILTMKKKM